MTTCPATLRDVLEQSAQQFAGCTSLVMVGGEAMTYAQLLMRVRKVQDLLTQYSVRPGDRVALLAENMPNWGVAFFAVTTMGAVAVPILPDFHPSDISNIIAHAEARAVFVSERLAPKVSELKNGEVVILLESFSVVDSEHRKSNETESPRVPIASGDLASIVYTSGTTGHSKGVMLTHGNLVSDALATREFTGLGEHDRMLSILPLGHTMECTLGPDHAADVRRVGALSRQTADRGRPAPGAPDRPSDRDVVGPPDHREDLQREGAAGTDPDAAPPEAAWCPRRAQGPPQDRGAEAARPRSEASCTSSRSAVPRSPPMWSFSCVRPVSPMPSDTA